jgi:hypothetical protein
MSAARTPETDSGRRQALLSPQPVILAVVLATLLAMIAVALQPGFRGGGFLTSALAIAIGLVGTILGRVALGFGLARDAGDDDVPLKVSEGGDEGWVAILRATMVIAGLFALVLLLGMVVGLTIAVFLIVRLHMKVPMRLATALALVWGVAIPAVFGVFLEVAIWPGLIPEIIPRWFGGGLLPPL